MKNLRVRELTSMAVIAALYVALCYAFAFMSYSPILQFRIAEILLVLAIYNKKYAVPVIIGTFIANQLMFGLIDMIIGTFATCLVLLSVILVKNTLAKKIVLVPAASVINGVIIGLMLYYLVDYDFGAPLGVIMANVAFGQFAVVLAGVLLFTGIEKTNPKIIEMIKNINIKNRGEKT